MNVRDILDLLAVRRAEELQELAHSVRNAAGRLDTPSGVDRLLDAVGYGHLIGLPTQPGGSSAATTGVPSNGVAGFARSALFLNFKGSAGSLLYVNTGSNTSATWTNIV